MSTNPVLGLAAAAAMAAGPEQRVAQPRLEALPPELLSKIFQYLETPIFPRTPGPDLSSKMLRFFESECDKEWNRICPTLRENRVIAAYIDSLELDTILLTGRVKFRRLFEAMTKELGIPESMRGVNPFSIDCYLRLSEALQDVSLVQAWSRGRGGGMRGALRVAGVAVDALPGPDAGVGAIRGWLNNPANTAVLAAVERLNLKECGLLLVPHEINKFKNINYLYLEWNRIIVVCPRQFEGLTSLRGLDLSSNQIASLPEDFLQGLDNLFYLELSYNKINSLPAKLFKDRDRLSTLTLSGNLIDHLPENIFQDCTRLEMLSLRHNQIRHLSANIFQNLVNLRICYLDSNKIEDLPVGIFRGLHSLKEIYLDHNRIKNLAVDSFQHLVDLEQLRLNHNRIRRLTAELFHGLTHLKNLNLEQNQIENLPENIFQDLVSLEGLNLNQNRSDFNDIAAEFLELSVQEKIAAIRNYYRQRRYRAAIADGRCAIF